MDRAALLRLRWPLAAVVATLVFSAARRRYLWSGEVGRATGTVVSCESRWNSDDGTVYTTLYEFSDDHGRVRREKTTGVHYCLPPGSTLAVTWPLEHPETVEARDPRVP